MGANQMSSEVVFDIAEVWFNWWHWWPFSILLLGIVALATVGYAVCESLPDPARRFLQRVALIAGSLWGAALLALVGLMTFIEFLSFRRLQIQRAHAELTVVEGELEIGIDDYARNTEPYVGSGRREPRSFKVVDSHNQKHAFVWKLGGGVSLGDVFERSRRDRLRVRFVPDPRHAHNKHRVERALTIERLAPEGK
jgi:hypothetical protein